MSKIVKYLGFIMSAMLSLSLMAQDTGLKVEIHGFLSQGYLKSTNNNYLIESKKGSFELNEAAITFSSQVSPKLRIGAQLLSRDFGREGNNVVGLDWGYGDYQYKDALGFRFGKIKIPYGFYNQGRDVDVLRTAILLPQSVYQEDMRDFTLACQGGSVYGNLLIPRIGSFEYECFFGTLSIPDPNSEYWRWVFSDFSELMNRNMQLPIGTFSNIKDPSVIGRYTVGGALRWNTPIQGLRLGYSNDISKLTARNKLEMVVPWISDLSFINPLLQGVAFQNIYTFNINIDVDVKQYNSLSAEFSWNDLTLTGEYHFQDYHINISGKNDYGLSFSDTTLSWESEGYYGQVNYRFSKWLELGTYYSNHILYPEDKKGEKLPAERGLPSYFAWQKDACLTARFDIIKNWILKIEGHLMDGCAQVKVMNNPDGTKRYWKLFAIKTSYQF